MKNQTVKKSRKLLSTLLVCGTLLGAVSAAGAVVLVGDGGAQVASAAVISDATTPRSITIHKYSNTKGAGTAVADDGTFAASIKTSETKTGTETGTETEIHKPLPNIPFKVVRVTPKANQTSATIIADDPNTYDVVGGTAQTSMTDKNGELTFDLGSTKASDGIYLVTELDSASVATKAAPFVVAVPLTVQGATATADDSLLYDVNVYPKNDTKEIKLNPVKSLVSGNQTTSAVSVKAGEEVTWDLSMDVPADIYTKATADTEEIYADKLQLMDPIDTRSLSTPTNITGSASSTTKEPVNLVMETDFIASEEPDDELKDYFTVKIELTEAGVKKVADYEKISFRITTEVLKDKVDGSILNSFDTLYVGPTGEETPETTNPTTDPDPKDPTPTIPDPNVLDPDAPVVKMGNIDVLKTDESNKPLANAVFKLAASEEDAAAEKWVTTADTKNEAGEVVKGEVITLKTDANGKIRFTGLKVDPTSGEQNYYLVETSAPVGYALDGTARVVVAKDDTEVDATVVNKDNKWVPNLPMTGDDARLILLISASTLIVAGGAALYIYRRKEQANN
ncbi:SpaH/EbpB family LPXTG-anchored major pilin [Enterococcus dongliensis]|uniref:SpaH/EbpB family LPXTG-anchored major pilin n=1 Tax=Enterococcus dongliensis TaxID=2559925 RepID=UPI0028924A24|nr:SpaH/EbpB family LPXTG-anchored major pilin [Enterococcus dongliensis]MDT2674670.1 SpaH/EbpB family LPXTG-anchored major pilin [Enterococcus dongliensis]